MSVTVDDILRMMEMIAPGGLAEEWDNPGLQVGSGRWPVEQVWVALDPLPEVISEACDRGIDLLVTHHPLIFRPLRRIDVGSTTGRILETAIKRRLAIVSVHTNLDAARGGLNDLLADRLGLSNVAALDPSGQTRCPEGFDPGPCGIGRIGSLFPVLSLGELALHVKDRLGIDAVRMAGDPDLSVSRVAVCTGSGGSLTRKFLDSDAQAYVSGDLRYHDARDAEAAGRGLLDIGHFASEHFMVDALSERLARMASERGVAVKIDPCRIEREPYRSV